MIFGMNKAVKYSINKAVENGISEPKYILHLFLLLCTTAFCTVFSTIFFLVINSIE